MGDMGDHRGVSIGDPLLAAIFAKPQVDEHRRVYADWLCERGDPRGEFILLQLAEHDGLGNQDTRARMQSLRRRHAKDWLGPLDHVVQRKSVEFERGFPVRARCKPRVRKPLRHFDEPSWATFEHLEDPPLALLLRPGLSALHSISLHRDHVRQLLREQQPLPRIDTLEVRGMRNKNSVIFFDERELFQRNTSLTGLVSLRFLNFATAGYPTGWLKLSPVPLRHLEVHDCRRKTVGPAGEWATWLRGSATTLETITLGDPDLAVTLGHVEPGDWARATVRLIGASPSDERVRAELRNLAKVSITAELTPELGV